MGKELKRRKKLRSIKDKKQRHEEELKYEEAKKKHRKHEKIHHPVSSPLFVFKSFPSISQHFHREAKNN